MVDLARAYEIPLPAGGTKKQILPPMIAAEQQGVFRTPPKHPYYLQKAGRNTDMPRVPMEPPPEIQQTVEPPPKERARRKESDYNRKQRLLQERGVPGKEVFGRTKADIDRMAEQHGIT